MDQAFEMDGPLAASDAVTVSVSRETLKKIDARRGCVPRNVEHGGRK
jgi:hypothetical protein